MACRALWVIGRAERGRATGVARAAFEEAYACASRNALPVFRVKSLQELGTIDMFETLGTARFEEARREALAAGAISMVAMVDLQLAATYSARGQAGLTLAAAARCEDASRRFGLASLPVSLALQAVAHGFSGNRTAMEAFAAQARAIGGDRDTVEMITLANGVALYHLGEDSFPRRWTRWTAPWTCSGPRAARATSPAGGRCCEPSPTRAARGPGTNAGGSTSTPR